MTLDPLARISKVRVSMLSEKQILAMSSGEVESADTMNHRTLLPAPGGLFCQRIFGPVRDHTCACPRPSRQRGNETRRCPRCGVDRIEANVRRRRFGHIPLASPVCHIWRYKGPGNQISRLTAIPPKKLDRIVHHTHDVITALDNAARADALEKIGADGNDRLAALIEKLEVAQPIHPSTARAVQREAPGAADIETGAEAIEKLLAQLDLEQELNDALDSLKEKQGVQRARAIDKIRTIQRVIEDDIDLSDMIIRVLLVIPPSLRPMMQMDSGQFASSDLNDLYRKVINRNNRLRRFSAMNTPDIILRNEKRLLQNAVDTLLDNSTATQPALGTNDRALRSLSDQLRGKKGRFRQNLLGKRVDYSGRSVIVSGPDLNLGQCGLPYEMAAELFRPHLLRKIMGRTEITTRQGAYKVSKNTRHPVVRKALDELATERVIILNRAPTLHRLSMQAFNPVLSDDKVIRLHPLSCGGFNADFDGDQMAVHAPISGEALEEAKSRMRGSLNTVSPADGSPSALPSLDIILGIYHMTMLEREGKRSRNFLNEQEALLARDQGAIGLRTPIRVAGIEGTTSAGRIMFNHALPKDVQYQNNDADKRLIGSIVMSMYESDLHSPSDIATTLDNLKNLGFRHAFLSGLSIGMSDMITPSDKPQAIVHAEQTVAQITESFLNGLTDEEERHEHTVRMWQQTSDAVKTMVEDIFPSLGDLHLMASSGAKGNIDNVRQMVGMRGLMSNPSGRTIERPVKSHFAQGLSVFEYFISTHGARKGLADTALRTADAGYLTRRLVDATHHIHISGDDCGTTDGLVKTPGSDGFVASIVHRRLAADLVLKDGRVLRAGGRITPTTARDIAENASEELSVRTPLLCSTYPSICASCYGDSLTTLMPAADGLTIGVIAAQSIGEPGTQLTMRTFHRGGVAGADITNGLPRVEEVLETRRPSLLATLCRAQGIITDVGPDQMKVSSLTSGETTTYQKEWQNATFTRSEGDLVEPGDILSTGSADMGALLELAGPQKTWEYATREIQAVYQGQGVDLHDKHIEIVLCAMFSFCEITDPGDTAFMEGEIARTTSFHDANLKAQQSGGRSAAAKPQVCGITQAALMADGFLSAASFQRTIHVLAEASLKRTVDEMKGLKENVIVGQTIPVTPDALRNAAAQTQ